MLAPTLFLGLVATLLGKEVANETTTHKPYPAEDLRLHRCIPTAVTRGPCHVCICNNNGEFHCHPEDCHFQKQKVEQGPHQMECEPGMLYTEGALWCNCSPLGFWKSDNCRANFRYIRSKKIVHPITVPEQACQNGSMYLVDCNVCACPASGALAADACTNRTCTPGAAEPCKRGQMFRDGNQLCACGAVGYKRCVILANHDKIQKIPSVDLASLVDDVNLRTLPMGLGEGIQAMPSWKCKPNTVIHLDCNRCSCTRSGRFACTNKLCIADSIDAVGRSGKELRSKHAMLPELKSDKEPCVPGKQYRLKCNTCYCTSKGVPACTSMICLNYFNMERKPRKEKGLMNHLHNSLPVIKEGENCTQGKTYRLDCNVCRCSDKNRLVCTKKLCMSNIEIAKQHEFENKMKKFKNKNVFQTQDKNVYLEAFPDKLVVHERIGHKKKGVRTADEQKTKIDKKENRPKKDRDDGDKSKENKSKSRSYPKLPKTKCEPGFIYSKGCQRCFCNNKKVAQCTNKPCDEMKGPVKTPTDVHPRITVKEKRMLPKLPHEAARCKPGKQYVVDCNSCLCLANMNLLCDKQLCLAVNEVNKIAAMKQTGKPCQIDAFNSNKVIPEVEVECIDCSCVQGKFECKPKQDCTPLRFRRALHGAFGDSPHMSLDAQADKCMPGMVYKQNCNNCYCQEDETLRCTRKGCLNFQQVEKLKQQRQRLLKNSL